MTLVCPGCGKDLWAVRHGEWTLANRVIKVVDGGLVAVCPTCPTEVPIPFLSLRAQPEPIRKARPAGVRMVVRVDRTRAP